MSPTLRAVRIGDEASAWQALGLDVADGVATVGGVRLELVGDGAERGLRGLGFADLPAGISDIDGIAAWPTATEDPGAPSHPGHVTAVDHVVVRTPDLARTIAALAAADLEVRRTRDVPIDGVAGQQAFVVAGTAVLEVVGPLSATGDGPAWCWGLALVSDDLAASAAVVGDVLGDADDAVQAGRTIATVDHRAVGGSVPTVLMSPRPRSAGR